MNEPHNAFAPLVFHLDEYVYLRPCTEVILYWAGSVFDHADSIIAFHDRSLDLIKDKVKYYRTETMGSAKPLKKDSLDLVRFWLKETTTKRDIYMLFLESGTVPDEPSEHAFSMNASPGRGFVRLVLPATFATESSTDLLSLSLNLAANFDYEFGTVGYSLNWNSLGKHVRRSQLAMNSLAPRYLGVDMSFPLATQFIVSTGIKCANWLTFVNASDIEKLGGAVRVKQALSNEATAHDVGSGLAIQAGPAPTLGDVNRQDNLSAYHRVGKVLAPVRAPKHPPIFGPGGIPDESVTEQWLARFDT